MTFNIRKIALRTCDSRSRDRLRLELKAREVALLIAQQTAAERRSA